MMRAAIYARYSTDLQREASIDDQVEVCKRLIHEKRWTVAKVYADRAASGASRFRGGLQQLLADADRRRFDVVVCEALDRLGRKLADVADLFDRLSFLGIRLHTAVTGEVTTLHIGLLGTMAQLYLSDLREKTKRGQLGRARAGRIPGGIAYGYEVVAPADAKARGGERRINEAEAAVVRRIYSEYAGGASPRAITKRLNAEGTPGPGGHPWRDTTIRGQADRGTGILNNPIYVGRLEWNRCSYVKDPRTGKRVARVNPRKAWEIVEVPELRIVDDALWERVKFRQKETRIEIGRDDAGNALNRLHRRRYLLSGLLVCGECGGGYTIVGKGRYGCATHRCKGTCPNSRTVARQEIEQRVLAGLKDRLMTPNIVALVVEEVENELNRLNREAESAYEVRRRELSRVTHAIEAMLRAIEDGMYNPSMKGRMTDLENKKATLEKELAGTARPSPLRLYPNLSAIYRDRVAQLEAALNAEVTRAEAADTLRGLIDRIVLTPAGDNVRAELHGDLARILALCEEAERKKKLPGTGVPGSVVSVVAGARNHRNLPIEILALFSKNTLQPFDVAA